jgi:phosphohistidine phosphatase
VKLIIMRHGEAEDGLVDANRALTSGGQSDVRSMARILEASGWPLGEIRTSPLVRTRQTGDLMARTLREINPERYGKLKLETDQRLAPGVDLDLFLEIFYEVDANQGAVWVFHSPDVARAAAILTGNRDACFYFTPGSMLAVSAPAPNPVGRCLIVWQQQPEYMRSLFNDDSSD